MKLLLVGVTALILTTAAHACSPAPSCWMKSSPEYLKSVCADYAKQHLTLEQIKGYLDEPDQISSFGKACLKVGVKLQAG